MEKVTIREPVCYLLNFGRPVGLEPTIYLSRPTLLEISEEENPWYEGEVIECYSYKDALSRILHYNISHALSDFKIVK